MFHIVERWELAVLTLKICCCCCCAKYEICLQDFGAQVKRHRCCCYKHGSCTLSEETWSTRIQRLVSENMRALPAYKNLVKYLQRHTDIDCRHVLTEVWHASRILEVSLDTRQGKDVACFFVDLSNMATSNA